MSFKFEWYYFGDLITLLEAQKPNYRNYLLWEMLVLSPKEAADNFEGTTGYGHDLFKCIRDLEQISQRSRYKWTVPNFSIDLKIHLVSANTPNAVKKQSFLTPKTIYVPWRLPIPGGEILAQRIKNHFAPTPLPQGTYKDKEHLLINQCLGAIDKLLFFKDQNVSKRFREKLSNNTEDQRNKIIRDYANRRLGIKLVLPDYPHFCIYPHSKMASDETYLEMNGKDKIILHLGLKLSHPPQIQATDVNKFAKWPDGGFG